MYLRRMKESTPAWVGSVAALFSDVAVIAWSIVLLAMIVSRQLRGGTLDNQWPKKARP